MSNANPIASTTGADPKLVEERKANLPLPDQPPVASDFNSSDASTVNVGSGGPGADSKTAELKNDGGDVGRTAKDGLSGIPNDAVTRDAKDKAGLEQTTGKDHGYPQKSDPSTGV
ncbi:uncharacterized protein K452DRAFT_319544 [Aplosporella prunicola CBS 121167]|uniref:Uncharacterized protein n=1 Tax=Aplosporella prunicola CBS 121167 TaxID=1176127 RepID=A0A6A6B917_9PEZI|nr:uncharacterized protein K452DRAFT_319544 [Aplosporella prunicola CBS 121167]KAF2140640.1 hypothetical protein K452DRAFT_319544 [Aplosporella prunicola CBS 121167]